MRRDQHITITKNNSQTDLVVIQDGDTPDDWLDLSNVTGDDVEWQIAEGTVGENFGDSDVVYEAPSEDINIVQWGNTSAQWPERFESDEDGVQWEIAPPPDGTLLVEVQVPPEATADLLATPIGPDGQRQPELVRECKVESPDDFAVQRTQLTVVQGNVTVLPSADDGSGGA
jgi:hypothetical protein